MSGMGSSLQTGNPTMVAAFRAALAHQGFDALVTRGATLADWRLDRGATGWHSAQSIHVPIQFGSSG